MRKEYGRYLKIRIEEELRQLSPTFVKFEGKSPRIWPTQTPYCHLVSEEILLVLALFVDPKGSPRFTFDFGWSKLGRFPEVVSSQCPNVSAERTEFRLAEYLKRYGTSLGEECKYWIIEEEDLENPFKALEPIAPMLAKARVDRAVREAIDDIKRDIVPYFLKFIQYCRKQ